MIEWYEILTITIVVGIMTWLYTWAYLKEAWCSECGHTEMAKHCRKCGSAMMRYR